MPVNRDETIAVIGLGYVGLPVAMAFARKGPTIGFDIQEARIAALRRGHDETREVTAEDLKTADIRFSTEPGDLREATAYIVAVPTPIDRNNRPDLTPLIAASETVGKSLNQGDVVIYESTVYPGVTEDICGPVLSRVSGLVAGVDFKLGYSPERINPGDTEHAFELIVKVVSGQDDETLERVATLYESVVKAGVHRAPSIKVAEAAKVIENTQRDLNIALMNELALIFERLGIRTKDVLEAAGTKWNFLPFRPGLVGGHCIGVDPYYLTTKAEELGYQPQVILAGQRINNGVGAFVAQRTLKMLSHNGVPLRSAKVAVLGLTFKEDVPDLRNSRVPNIVAELGEFGVKPAICCPMSNPEEARRAYHLELSSWESLRDLDALIVAVAHRQFLDMPRDKLLAPLKDDGIVIDVKSVIDPSALPRDLNYWSL